MATVTIPELPVAISLDGTEQLEIVQPPGSGGGVSKSATAAQIANTATGFIPTSAQIVTDSDSGLSGGTLVSSSPDLSVAPSRLSAKTTPVPADLTIIGDSASSYSPAKATIAQFYTSIGGLTELSIPNLTTDMLVIRRSSDGTAYKISPSGLSLASGNVPAGGTINQVLAKASSTNYDTVWATPFVQLDATSIAANTTGSSAANTSVTLGATLAFVSSSLRTVALSGDISSSANSFVTAIGANKVTNAMLRQSSGLSVIGRSASTTGDVADVTGVAYQILRVNSGATALGFGSIDLSQSAAVGSTVLAGANGGTGVANTSKTITLGGSLTTSGAFDSTFTMSGSTSVTFPTSGTLATTGGANIPSITQGDLLYGSASNVLSALAKSTTATRYLGNTGTSNNPAWAQVDLTNGVTGSLPLANGGTNASLTASNGGIFYSSATAGAILSGTATAGQHLQSGASSAPSWTTATFPSTATGTGTILRADGTNWAATTATYPATTTINQILYSSSGNVIAGLATANGGILNASATGVPSLTVTPVIGLAGTSTGTVGLSGVTSGVVTIQPQSAAGTYNFNLPTGAGTSGQPLLSAGGGSSPMTFGTLGVAGGGTGVASLTAYAVVCGGTTSTGAVQSIASVGTSGQLLTSNGAASLPTMQSQASDIEFVIDGGGVALTTGIKGYLEIPYDCTITRATLLADQSGSVVVDIFKCTYSAFDPPTHPASADKITASAPPTISTAKKSQDSTLTGWTTSVTSGDILAFNVNSATTITRVTCALKVNRTSAS